MVVKKLVFTFDWCKTTFQNVSVEWLCGKSGYILYLCVFFGLLLPSILLRLRFFVSKIVDPTDILFFFFLAKLLLSRNGVEKCTKRHLQYTRIRNNNKKKKSPVAQSTRKRLTVVNPKNYWCCFT